MKSLQGLLLGLLLGAVDCGLYWLTGAPISLFDVATALCFWSICGWLVHSSDLPLAATVKGLLITLALNLPWAIDFAGRGLASEVLPFMLVIASLFAVLLGWVSDKPLLTRTPRTAMDQA